jgi:integrase
MFRQFTTEDQRMKFLVGTAAITDVQHLLGHASVKTTEKAYAAFVKNERFKQTIDLLDKPVLPKLKKDRPSLLTCVKATHLRHA